MRRKLSMVVLGWAVLWGAAPALGESIAVFSWEFEGGGDTAVLNGPGDTAVIDVYIEINVLFAGWHYDLNAAYDPGGIPNFEMTDLWVMPEADRYGGLVTSDINDYRSFADILEQAPGVYWLDPGIYLIEKLTITGTGNAANGTLCFDATPGTGYNILYKDPLDGIEMVPDVTIPDCLTVIPEPTTWLLLAFGGSAVLRSSRKRRAASGRGTP